MSWNPPSAFAKPFGGLAAALAEAVSPIRTGPAVDVDHGVRSEIKGR
jgi:hypothetical protein